MSVLSFNSIADCKTTLIHKFDPSSEKEILRIPQPGPTQNGGQLFFGPTDGYLYISTGDGGNRNESRFDTRSLLGKILRLDVSGENVAIPSDNPFVGKEAYRGEIFAYGFRNPWRCAVDPRWIICGDVGEHEHDREEINVVVKGGRYGWIDHRNTSCRSVKECQDKELVLPQDHHVPVHSYKHDSGQAVVGGVVYSGSRYPSLSGLYIYADYVHGTFHTLRLNPEDVWVESEDLCVDFLPSSNRSIHVTGLFEKPNGEIYMLANSGMINSDPTGAIYVLISSSAATIRDFLAILMALATFSVSSVI